MVATSKRQVRLLNLVIPISIFNPKETTASCTFHLLYGEHESFYRTPVIISANGSLSRLMDKLRAFLKRLKREDIGPALRMFFINTLFDSTFMLIGVIMGSSLVENPNIEVTLSTMFTTSLALGISTGVSVFEAESLERERKIARLEKALFRDLENTNIARSAKEATIITSVINFFTPIMSCMIVAFPMILVYLNILDVHFGVMASIGVALGTLFATGAYLGRVGKHNPLLKGLRMVVFGVIAFTIGYLLQTFI